MDYNNQGQRKTMNDKKEEDKLDRSKYSEKTLRIVDHVNSMRPQLERLSDNLEVDMLKDELSRMKAQEYERQLREQQLFFNMLGDAHIVERLKNVTCVSNKIRLDMLRNILKISDDNKEFFDEKIFDWALEFGFRIDGDFLLFEQDAMLEFIGSLEKQFEEWSINERKAIDEQLEFWKKEEEEAFEFEKWLEKNKNKK